MRHLANAGPQFGRLHLCAKVRMFQPEAARTSVFDGRKWTISGEKGCAEGRSPFAGSLRVSLRYKFFPRPGQDGGQGEYRRGVFSTL